MTKHLLAALLALAAFLARPVVSLAQPSEAGAAAAPADVNGSADPVNGSAHPVNDAASVAEPSAQPSAQPTAVPAPERGTDLAVELAAARKALDEHRGATGPKKRLLLFGLLAAITWFLNGLIRRVNNSWPKTWLPKIAAGLGAIAGGTTYLAGGASWPEALLYGFGPPLAVFLHEVLKPSNAQAQANADLAAAPTPSFMKK